MDKREKTIAYVGGVLAGIRGIPHTFEALLGYIGKRLKRAYIVAGEPAVRSEKLHVQRMVLPPAQHSALLGVPTVFVFRTPGKFQSFFDGIPIFIEEFFVA